MKLKSVTACGLLLSLAVATVFGQSSFDLANLDKNTQACTDFYQYATGGWLNRNPIPAAYPTWGVDSVLSEQNRDQLREILEAAAKNTNAAKGSSEQKVGDFYASCMNEEKIEADGIAPLATELALIDKIKDQRGLQNAIAHLHTSGVNALFLIGSKQDAKNSAEVIAEVWQGGLGLPEGEYYFKTDDKSKEIREAYLKHVAKMFELMGDDAAKAASESQAVMNFETKLAEAWMPRVDRRDPQKVYNRKTLAQLKTFAPNFDWPGYLKAVGIRQNTDVNLGQPKFVERVNQQLTAIPLADWKTYLRWRLVNSAAASLSKKFVEEDFDFKGRMLTGTTEILPRWKRCVASADNEMGEALGEVYVKKAFPPEAKRRALELVANLVAALRSDISTLSWMSDPTRKQAITKLEAFIRKIGYPDKWRDYSALEIDRGSYVNNVMRADSFEAQRDLRKIGKPVDKAEWGMTPATVNAYYNPAINEIVFPAGIMQPPYFSIGFDDALNYGAMGSVIGHEMTHGFDDQGRQYDASGNLANWWTDADMAKFKERAECIVKQFDGFEVEPGLFQNGKLVQGESIADLGGLVVAYAAFQKSMEGKPRPANIGGFTPEQRFFLGYAFSWATNVRPEFARLLVATNPHPLPKFRVNGPLANFPAFAEAFQCKTGDTMVRADKERCQIW
ncbi:MAG TPA: M13 family metallopeptidase [Pyrinomonadaceae bacterium]|jgi:putative endopeptidase|nr:M13 family metallopeptidase [Pyrinomonadaceae bacterium]